MAIDYVIDLQCVPKEQFSTEGIVDRLKGEDRARKIIQLFRENGDHRPPSEMGFEFSRSSPEGEEERRVIVVQELLDAAEALQPVAHHCQGCPANRTGQPFGCIGFIDYPISAQGEQWMLDRLPVPDETLVWLLLRQGLEEFKYDGETVKPLRDVSQVYFEDSAVAYRRLGEVMIDANQFFEMLFAVGHINPNHAAVLLLFIGGITRDLEADEIIEITRLIDKTDTRYRFLIEPEEHDDQTVIELKEFFRALYIAWQQHLRVLVDA
ncbi:MAG: hypothetical protein MUF87_21115 [Anaerolineae bacterium]|jgi:hypothetical protein|nr:hypothetical protein [Anaerolineae bacterium]